MPERHDTFENYTAYTSNHSESVLQRILFSFQEPQSLSKRQQELPGPFKVAGDTCSFVLAIGGGIRFTTLLNGEVPHVCRF